MEAAGAIDSFTRSIDKNNLIYHKYIGDSDTLSFKEVVDANPCENYDIIPSKLECIGHVQKRLRTRLCNCLESYKGTNQPISGKGKLTEKVINSMQNYYGMAIRNNVDDIHNMRKATGAVLHHSANFKNQDYRHSMCPNHENSWCKYQLDKINGTQKYKNTITFQLTYFLSLNQYFRIYLKRNYFQSVCTVRPRTQIKH